MMTLLINLLSLLCFAGPVPNFQLVNQNGKPFQLHDFKGTPVLISFIYTRCPVPKMCPLTVNLTKAVQRLVKKGKNSRELKFLFVTLDPTNDTPETLKKFAVSRNLDPKDFTLATGNPQTLADLAAEFNVIGIPEGGLVSHNQKSILLDKDLSEIKQFKENEWQPKDVLIALLAKSK